MSVFIVFIVLIWAAGMTFLALSLGFIYWPVIAAGAPLLCLLAGWRFRVSARRSCAQRLDQMVHLLTFGRVVSAMVADVQTFHRAKGLPDRVAILEVEGRTVTVKTKNDVLANHFKLGVPVDVVLDDATDLLIPRSMLP